MTDEPTDATLAGLLRGLARAPAADLPPTMIGRFKITRTLGSGGMGVVYEAEDPTLGRKVAIKLLREERDGTDADAAAARLLREAQALAKLSHPNVVTIYEAGRDGHRVYLAMELIVGATARAWREAAPRTTDEILAIYRQAATGLAAAHRAGMVHRDVKPENLLVGDDGRVRVTDFGLVAALELRPVAGQAPTAIDPMGLTMTRTGAVMGTPPYMPPEAHRALQVDARGNQWSLCVAIWEAVGGARPYAATTYPELVDNICAGRRVDPPRPLPDRLRVALERGLAVDPAARWPSVTALLDALTHRSRRGLALGVAALAAAGLGAGGWWMTRAPAATPRAPDTAVVAAAVAPALDASVDAALPAVALHATPGAIELPCTGALCGDAVLHADGETLAVTVTAPPGLLVRLPGAEGGDGATLAFALDPLIVRAELPAPGATFAPLAVWASVVAAPGAPGASHRFSLAIDRYVEARLAAVRAGGVPWPGEVQPRFRDDVLIRMSGGRTGPVAYLGYLGPPGATLWEADQIAFEEEEARDTPCGRQTELVVRVFDRRAGRDDAYQRFHAGDVPCRTTSVATYDPAAVEAWLQARIQPRPAGVDEEAPPDVPLGAAAVAAATVHLDTDALAQDAIDAVAKALHDEEPMWPGERTSKLAARLRKLKLTDPFGVELIGVLDEATAYHGDDAVEVIELTIPRSTSRDDVHGLVTPTWAVVVVGHRTLVPDAGQALFDAVTAVAPDAAAMNDAAVALGWWDPEPRPSFGPHAVPYLRAPRLMLHGPSEAPIGASLVVALDYADAVGGQDPSAVCEVEATRVRCVRSDDRVLARRVLDALR